MPETKQDPTQRWTKDCAKFLEGKTIKKVRYMTNEEAEAMGWFSRPLAIFFDDGSFVYASADDEGNDGGALFTSSDDLPIIPVMR